MQQQQQQQPTTPFHHTSNNSQSFTTIQTTLNNDKSSPDHLQFIADFASSDSPGTSDNSKKRRKQTTPLRLSSDPNAGPIDLECTPDVTPMQSLIPALIDPNQITLATLNELQSKLHSAMAQQFGNPQNAYNMRPGPDNDDEDDDDDNSSALESGELHPQQRLYANNLDCDQCPARFDSEIKLGLHVLQAHGLRSHRFEENKNAEHNFQIRVKKELMWDAEEDFNKNDDNNQHQRHPSENNWLSMAGLPFPFSPEAAAMLSASGYLGQMPQMLASVPGFGGVGADGMPRQNIPPIRIFNPEAYCDLCNKEFCNKYFLKTHKANKHNIYEPSTTGNGESNSSAPNSNQLNHMSQMMQMQQQQHHQHQQQQQQQMMQIHQQMQQQLEQNQHQPAQQQHSNNSPQSIPPIILPGANNTTPTPIDQTVPCDVCHRRFSNAASMRRHRAKAHESQTAQQPKIESNESQAPQSQKFTVPDGFREDFTVEQEDTSFTPQIRKLSPASSQLARDSNFSNEKLRRLGVINPEAFCEICCKEYCNKYFLRTHKLKRHGIFMPMDGEQGHVQQQQQQHQMQLQQQMQIQQQALGAFDNDQTKKWLQFVQTAPLNLMMASHPMKRSLDLSLIETETNGADDDPSIKRPRNTESPIKSDTQINEDAAKTPQEEAISVDLQKLQSMIMQLNDLSAKRPAACSICGKEVENQYMLHAHMVSEHSTPGDNNNGSKMSPSHSSSSLAPICELKTDFLCKLCDKELKSEFALRHHNFEVHGIQTPSHTDSPSFIMQQQFPRKIEPMVGPGLPQVLGNGDRRPYTITPTSSYCEICNKELCNKYFMKTHMQRMHGIEIENGAQIGGVICNICNKELCSKYFLRVHKHNTHGIVDEGSAMAIQQANRANGEINISESAIIEPISPGMSSPLDLKPGEISEMGNRYFSHFSEVCPICNRRFRGSKWLRTHLMTDHGKAGADKLREIEHNLGLVKQQNSPTLRIPNGSFGFAEALTMKHKHAISNLFAGGNLKDDPNSGDLNKPKEYNCSYCPFSTPSYAFLFIHERSHSLMGFINDSESAVSPAKQCAPNISSTPAMQSSSASTSVSPYDRGDHNPNHSNSPPRCPSTAPKEAATVADFAQRSPTASVTATHQMLNDLANSTKRPAAYALPTADESTQMVMQSFLMEEIVQNESNGTGTTTPSGSDHQPPLNRFVPSIVYLPVKQRFPDKLVVSFTLTPA